MKMFTISILSEAGDFAENKDAAARLRDETLIPALEAGAGVVIDFKGVRLTTQSFIHALLSASLRTFGEDALKRVEFKSCSPLVRGIVETVVQYSLESRDSPAES